MTDCNKKPGKCPPKYKNIGSENFGDNKRVTTELLYQFCKNDSYLYEQVKSLWDKTDPETRKRFYPPYYMDDEKSYGVEAINIKEIPSTDHTKVLPLNDAYHLSNILYEDYIVDFDNTNDKVIKQKDPNNNENKLLINTDTIIEYNNTTSMHIVSEDVGTEDNPIINHYILPTPVTSEVSNKIPYKTYTTTNNVITTKKTTKKKKVTKKETYGKLTLDANCSGPYKDWKNNSVWYIGYNRHKNYNIKNTWRKNPDSTDIPSVCRAQTFKAEHTGELRKIVLQMRGSSKSASPCIVEIRTVNKNGKPSTKILARTEQKFNHSTKAMVNFTFKKPCKVKKGTKYAIVIRSPLSNFNDCYWISGWASTCFSNSRKRAYYGGDTFLSENNGKTWILHGSKEKCYGSHYYDWGFAEAPVNFGFEVYIAPQTGTKSVTSYVPVTKITQTPEVIESTDYYNASVTLEYYEKGIYYLEFKPFVGNQYVSISAICNDIIGKEDIAHGKYSWEIFDSETGEWESFEDYNNTNTTPTLSVSEGIANYTINFNKALTFVKVRLKLELDNNILVTGDNTMADIQEELEKMAKMNESVVWDGTSPNLSDWIEDIYSQFAWTEAGSDDTISVGNSKDDDDTLTSTTYEDKVPVKISRINSIEFILSKKPSHKGYLRTLEYHPIQDGMLPACIWSEVDVDGVGKNDGTCKVDIIHEQNSIDHKLLYKITNLELRQYILTYLEETSTTSFNNSSQDYTTEESIRKFIYKDNDTINTEFVKWLQEQTPSVYLLPYEHTIKENDGTTSTKMIYFFGNKDNAPITLDDYPAYPINSCSIGTEDIHLNMLELSDELSVHLNDDGTSNTFLADYFTDVDLTDKINNISVLYHYDNPNGEGDIESEVLTLTEGQDYSVEKDRIVFNIGKKYEPVGTNDIFNNPLLKQFIKVENGKVEYKSNSYLRDDSVASSELIIEVEGQDYNEFQNYIVDYDNKTLNFYHPLRLVEGELKINYNPLWVRDLEVSDFPLKMDLWTEYYHSYLGYNEDNVNVMYYGKCKIGDCGKVVTDSLSLDGMTSIELSVAPLDNIRKVELQDFNGETIKELVEDIDFTVDYLSKKIHFVSDEQLSSGVLHNDITDGMLIMVKYTPNLTDTGLSLGFRLSRPLYNGDLSTVISEDDGGLNVLESVVRSGSDGDDYYVLSNYFTTRT